MSCPDTLIWAYATHNKNIIPLSTNAFANTNKRIRVIFTPYKQ